MVRAAGARGEAPPLEFGSDFHLPASLEQSVRFWIDVFTRYSLNEAIVHDRDDPAQVLAVVRLDGGRTEQLDAVRRRYRKLTTSLRTASPGEVAPLLAPFGPPLDPHWLAAAVDRIRVQPGQREVFRRSIMRSQRYLPLLRRVLRDNDVPPELAYLPHVESSFDVDAESHAGAIGLWQLMPETARQLDLRVDAKVDERKQPYKATAAAASYLREAYEQLQSWPLAITSYNYGINGTRRAVDSIGSQSPARRARAALEPAVRLRQPQLLRAVPRRLARRAERGLLLPRDRRDAPSRVRRAEGRHAVDDRTPARRVGGGDPLRQQVAVAGAAPAARPAHHDARLTG